MGTLSIASLSTPVKIGVPLAAAALLASACSSSGGGGGGGTTSGAAGGATTSSVTVVATAGTAGKFLTDGSGRALYLWVADPSGRSNCAGACAAAWPPLTVNGAPTAGGGATATDLGTLTRSDGTKQVTYKGHPLYRYAGDSGPGQTSGQGSDEFGANWWLVSPTGAKITGSERAAGSAAASSPAGGSGGGYNY